MGKFVKNKVFPSLRKKTYTVSFLEVNRHSFDIKTDNIDEIKDTFEKVIELAQTHGYGSALKEVLTSEDDCYQHLNIKDFRSWWGGVEDIEAREKFGEKREVMCHDRYDI
jgi:hypothetical protein